MKIVIFFIFIIICICRSDEPNNEKCAFESPLSLNMLEKTFRCVKTKNRLFINPITFSAALMRRSNNTNNCQMLTDITTFEAFVNNCYCFTVAHSYDISQVIDLVSEMVFGKNPHLATFFGPSGNDSSMMPNDIPTCENRQTLNITQSCPKSECNCTPNTTYHFMPNVSLSCPPLDCLKCDRGIGKTVKFD